MKDRKPIVDITRKPSRWRRFVAWCWSLLDPPEPYRSHPCDAELERTIYCALLGLIAVALIVAWVFWPRSL